MYKIKAFNTNCYDNKSTIELIYSEFKRIEAWIEDFLKIPNRKVIVMRNDFKRNRKKCWKKILIKTS